MASVSVADAADQFKGGEISFLWMEISIPPLQLIFHCHCCSCYVWGKKGKEAKVSQKWAKELLVSKEKNVNFTAEKKALKTNNENPNKQQKKKNEET